MSKGWNRRDFLKGGALASLMVGGGSTLAGRLEAARRREDLEGKARNIVFLVSDGMSTGTLTAADLMLRRRDGRTSHWIRLYEERRGHRGLMDMASLDSVVTDSAAAAASWGSGRRVNNGSLNIGPAGEKHAPILPLFRAAGKATGLVTTTRLTHATPAGFLANVPSRGMEDEIAVQYLERGADVLLGGGNAHFDPSRREDGRDLYGEFRSRDYRVVKTREELGSLSGDRRPLLGIFSESHLPYSLDRESTAELKAGVPTLAEMTRAALERLSAHPGGFLLQVEGGRVDHAAHANDVGGLIFDQIAFDEAIGVVLDFYERHPDTLVLLTTDHGNANPGLNGYGDADGSFDRIGRFRYTNGWVLEGLSGASRTSEIRDRVEQATRIAIAVEEAEILQKALNGEYEAVYRRMSLPAAVIGQILANYTSFNFMGTAHTSDYVELWAIGPGSSLVEGFTVNTELFKLMTQAAGVEAAV